MFHQDQVSKLRLKDIPSTLGQGFVNRAFVAKLAEVALVGLS